MNNEELSKKIEEAIAKNSKKHKGFFDESFKASLWNLDDGTLTTVDVSTTFGSENLSQVFVGPVDYDTMKPEEKESSWKDLGTMESEPLVFETETNIHKFVEMTDKFLAQKEPYYYHYPQKYIIGMDGFYHPDYAAQQEEPVYEKVREVIPGLDSSFVTCPVADPEKLWCYYPGGVVKEFRVWYMIQHLNDRHLWDRGRIADWLETLDIDLSFPTPETIPKEPGEV